MNTPLRHAFVATSFSVIQAVALVLLSACAQTDENRDYVAWTHARITENFHSYNSIRRTKALAGCINWENSTPEDIDLRHVNSYYTGEGSDIPVFAGHLMNSALANCEKARKAQGSNCTCVPIDKLGNAVVSLPDSFVEKLQIANVLATEGERQQAKQLMREGLAAYERGDYDQAIRDYDEAIRFGPNYARTFILRGNAYSGKWEYKRAIQDYTEAIRLKPNSAWAFNNRGAAYLRQGEYDRAIKDCDEAIRLKPDFALAFNNRGFTYAEKGEHDRAIRDFDEAIRLKPDFASAFKNRANAFSMKGEYDRASKDHAEARRLSSD